MSRPGDYRVEFEPAAMRLRYVEPRRSLALAVDLTAADTWQLRPDSIGWWNDERGRRTPVTKEEKTLVLLRVLKAARNQHRLRLHLPGQPAPPPTTETGAEPVVETAPDGHAVDPELAQLEVDSQIPDARRLGDAGGAADLLARIDRALARVQPSADAGWEQGQSIARQLVWCRGALRGESVETPPGPFSMGLIATREFDMYGSDPELAALINGIEREMQARLRLGG